MHPWPVLIFQCTREQRRVSFDLPGNSNANVTTRIFSPAKVTINQTRSTIHLKIASFLSISWPWSWFCRNCERSKIGFISNETVSYLHLSVCFIWVRWQNHPRTQRLRSLWPAVGNKPARAVRNEDSRYEIIAKCMRLSQRSGTGFPFFLANIS